MLLRNDVLFFLVEALAWEERVFIDVVGDLLEDSLREALDQGETLFRHLNMLQVLCEVLHFIDVFDALKLCWIR